MRSAKLFAAALLVLLCSAVGFSQGLTAVTGRVTDPTGAIIPGVEITVTNTATGASRTVLSNELGVYSATQLAPGTYNIKAELPGFKPKGVNSIPLPVDQTITLNLPMEVGAVTDVVDVTASAEVVNTENAQLGNGFDSKKILDLPLNARNIVGLLSLQTGVSSSLDATDGTTAGYVNGARNDQQNIVLDGVGINKEQGALLGNASASPFAGALPTTLDSVQEFIVQTSGQSATSGRSSGAQVQLVTKSGSNQIHGSAYEAYRSKVTTATPYFNGQATPKPGLIRNIPGGSIGGPLVKNKLFFFGAYEQRTDRSQTTVTKSVPNATYLQGILRYQRKASAGGGYGTITTGCGGMLEKITGLSCDTVNPALFGANGYFQQYAKYTNDPGSFGGQIVCPSDCSNFTSFKFNAPNIVNNRVYIARFDYNINSKNTVYVRGTLNNAATVGSPTFPDIPNGTITYDNSKGFAASLNSVLTPTINNNFTAGLTREAGNTTGTAAVSYGFGPDRLFQTAGANRRAIDTWNFTDNLSWIKGAHSWTGGVNFSFISNDTQSYSQVSPGSFSSAANYTVGDFAGAGTVTLGGAIGPDFANINNVSTVENAVINAIGGLNLYSVGLQWDKNGNLLPVGSPFLRTIRMDQYDLYLQDSWKLKPNLSLNYGIHWGVMSPPWEKNGNQVNWTQNLGSRYNTQKESPYTADQMPLLTTQLAGRANGLPDYYAPALNNWAPRASFAYSPKFDNGVLGTLAHKGGQMVIRGSYALSFDHTGGRLATDASASGGIGLFTSQQFGQSGFSIDGAGKPRMPRVGGSGSNLVLPYDAFPVVANQSYTPASSAGGWGAIQGLQGIDSSLRPPSNHLVNLTISKELPGGLVIEGSYVGRFARGLFGVLDLANPVNVVDKQSGMDYYTALKTLFETYENNGVGGAVITATNAAALTSSIKPIPWFEGVYGGFKNWAETGIGPGVATTNGVQKPDAAAFPGVTFPNATAAFYAVINKGLKPGPNAPIVLTNATQFYESDTNQHITTNPQSQYLPLYKNAGWSNYNSAQLNIKKRFAAGYTLNANYTWSKSLDVTSASESAGQRPGGSGGQDQLIDPYHPEKQYAPSTFDRTHQLNGNFVAELPFGAGKPIGRNMGHALNQVLGGWAVSGIFTAATGTPFSYRANLRYTMHYNGLDNPIQTAPIEYGLNHGPNAAHTVPMVYWIKDQEQSDTCDAVCAGKNRTADVNNFMNIYPGGPVARNYARGPGFYNLDATLSKTVQLTEKVTGKFSADAFNVLNHPNFGNPSVNIDGNANLLGNITNFLGNNRIMQFNVRLQF